MRLARLGSRSRRTLEQGHERPHEAAGAAGIARGVLGVAPARPGDVEVDPGRRAHELLEKLGRRDRPPHLPPTFFRSATWLLSCSLKSSSSGSRQTRSPVLPAGGDQLLAERLVVAEQAGDLVAQRDDARAGEGGQVEHACGCARRRS